MSSIIIVEFFWIEFHHRMATYFLKFVVFKRMMWTFFIKLRLLLEPNRNDFKIKKHFLHWFQRMRMISHSNSNWAYIKSKKPSKNYGFPIDEPKFQNKLPPKSKVSAHFQYSYPQTYPFVFHKLKVDVVNSKICKILSEFCARSTIHGVKYIVDRNLHWIER